MLCRIHLSLPTHENGHVGDLDKERESSTKPVDNLKIINSNQSLHVLVTQAKPNCIWFLKFIDMKWWKTENWVQCIFVCAFFLRSICVCVCVFKYNLYTWSEWHHEFLSDVLIYPLCEPKMVPTCDVNPLKTLGFGFRCFMIIPKNIIRVKLGEKLCLSLRFILCSGLDV